MKDPIELVRSLTKASCDHYAALNGLGRKDSATCARREKQATRAILHALLQREPTDEEIEQAMTW